MTLKFMAVLFMASTASAAEFKSEGYFALNLGVQKVHLAHFEHRFTMGVDGGSRVSERYGYALNFQTASGQIAENTDTTQSILGASAHWYCFNENIKSFYVGPSLGFAFETVEINANKASEVEPYLGVVSGWTFHINERFASGIELRVQRVLGDPKAYSMSSALSTIRILF